MRRKEVSGRISTLSVDSKPAKTAIVNAHAPTEDAELGEKQNFMTN